MAKAQGTGFVAVHSGCIYIFIYIYSLLLMGLRIQDVPMQFGSFSWLHNHHIITHHLYYRCLLIGRAVHDC